MRKTLRASPGRFANPKNLTGLAWPPADPAGGSRLNFFPGLSVATDSPGVGMKTSACDTKMFLPEPSYLMCFADGEQLQVEGGVEALRRMFFFCGRSSAARRGTGRQNQRVGGG